MAKKDHPTGPFGILEISSNTVRFYVEYADPKIRSTLNEEVKCALGDYPEGTKELNPEGLEKLYDALERWRRNFFEPMEFNGFAAIGTGALREATNTKELVKKLKKDFGIKLDIISGNTEAHYGALGVMSSFDGADGVMMDQGGRSAEFAIIKNGEISKPISLPLGTFSIQEQDDPESYIKAQLDTLPKAYNKRSFENLYLVGGTTRRVMAAHKNTIAGEDGPLHGYSIPSSEVSRLSEQLLEASPETLREEFDISKKRVDLVPASARLLQQLKGVLDVKNITASEQGLRQGILHEMMEQRRGKEGPTVNINYPLLGLSQASNS